MNFGTDLSLRNVISALEDFHSAAQNFGESHSRVSIKRWHDDVRDYLAEHFFDDAVEEFFVRQADYTSAGVFWADMSDEDATGDVDLPKARKAVRRLIHGVKNSSPIGDDGDATIVASQDNKSSIFIVHGHNENILLKVKSVLVSQDLSPIVLSERPNGGATIIEKFEREANVGFAVVIMSSDDLGKAKNAETWSSRARQNVLLELGYFIGKLGRDKVCALREKNVELPSDIFGVVYTEVDASGHWKYELANELQHAGYAVDKNKI